MKQIILVLFSTIVLGGFFLVVRAGYFRKVEIHEATEGPWHLVGAEHLGSYHLMAKTLQEVETWAKNNNVPCEKTFGIYYDNPDMVEEARLKSFGGCILETEFKGNLPEKYKTETRETGVFVKALFYGSPALGPVKVYGQVDEFMRDHNLAPSGPVMEVYRIYEQVKAANVIEISDISEILVSFYYPRRLPLLSYRKFVLVPDDETQTMEVDGLCYFSDENADDSGKYMHQFVFFGLSEAGLAAMRVWLRQQYVQEKSKG